MADEPKYIDPPKPNIIACGGCFLCGFCNWCHGCVTPETRAHTTLLTTGVAGVMLALPLPVPF